jgi:hypothetical protein
VDKAKNHLKKALSFDPDNPQASKLWKTAKMMDTLKQVTNRNALRFCFILGEAPSAALPNYAGYTPQIHAHCITHTVAFLHRN